MYPFLATARAMLVVLLCHCLLAGAATAQQAGATGEPLVVKTPSLARGFLRQPYQFQLQAEGGIKPLVWQLERGPLPPGLKLSEDGVLSGNPSLNGEFEFTVSVTDSGKPSSTRSQDLVLDVVVPLLVEWGQYPKVNGQRIEGSIKVSNQTGEDFDLTMIVLAVNEIGRATAIGYQHFTLKQDTFELELPFGENLSSGGYKINVDVVGEVAESNRIYRSRLASRRALQVLLGP
jgi:hypothetical protein